jgi:dTMP kinase
MNLTALSFARAVDTTPALNGLFITFEGTEGSGKSTQARQLAERLRRLGLRVQELREPGGTPLGEEIRHTLKHSRAGAGMTPEAELLLLNAARAQLIRESIRPALERGDVVLCDRFTDSTIAYQAWGRGLDCEWVRRIIDFAVGPTRPDLTLLLCVPPAVSAARLSSRGINRPGAADRFEAAGPEFFERVARGYRALATDEPERVHRIDATGDVEAVHTAVWACVAPRLGQPA